MDFDSFIIFVLFITFFILPSVLQQIKKARKKKGASTAAAPKGRRPAWVKIQEFLAALDARARSAESSGPVRDNIWDSFRDEPVEEPFLRAEPAEERAFDREIKPGSATAVVIEKPLPQQKVRAGPEKSSPVKIKRDTWVSSAPEKHLPERPFRFKKNDLQNAVVFSEIIGRPVALKQDQ